MISSPLTLALVLLPIMFGLLLASKWIAFSLISTGIAGLILYDANLPPVLSIWDKAGTLLANSIWNS
ncbi:MAG: C4-dicarboxylate ABC transporter permease, partial [Desulfohalobiaceae bacterium]